MVKCYRDPRPSKSYISRCDDSNIEIFQTLWFRSLETLSNVRPEKEPEPEKPKPAPAPAPKPPAKKPAARKGKGKKKVESESEEEEDAMEESEEEEEELVGDADDDDDDDGSDSSDEERELDMETFDTQTLVKDDEDKKMLDALPELEREAILGERFEKLKAQQDMKKALRESRYVVCFDPQEGQNIILMLTQQIDCIFAHRRKKREQKGEKPAKTSKRKAETKAKEPPKKKAKAAEEIAVDTSNDADIAAKLADTRGSGRNRDATGAKSKKASALAKLREVSQLFGRPIFWNLERHSSKPVVLLLCRFDRSVKSYWSPRKTSPKIAT